MCQDSKYRVILLDADGFDISEQPADTLPEAKAAMAHILSEDYAKAAETTHAAMGSHKVEVRNAKGTCILDKFFE